jgi:pyruvate formate lyase activating enzyme
MNSRPPLFFSEADSLTSEDVYCDLCPNRCKIASGRFGACGVRGNKGGKGIIPFYGIITALAIDPIEKKPLYHFKPGTQILSLGFAGCNLHCPFCQNWHISRPEAAYQSADDYGNQGAQSRQMTPGEIISAALKHDSPSIAYTYSEPLVHIEFLLDCMTLARRHGIANVLVTNGCINEEAAAKILTLTDAANVDLKTFSEDTYKKTLGGDLNTVLNFIQLCHKMNVHVEVTTLVVPDLNDSNDELADIADFIAGLESEGAAIPWHLSAYHPDYRWNAPPTEPQFLLRTAKEAGKKVKFVYTGNIAGSNDTLCSGCGAVLVRRSGYRVDVSGLAVKGDVCVCGKCECRVEIIC